MFNTINIVSVRDGLIIRRCYMKKIALLVLTITFSIGISAVVFAGAPARIVESNFTIDWSDEFNGTELDKNTWTPLIGNGSNYGNWEWGNNEKQFYKEENASVSDGSLKINAKYEANAGTAGSTTYNFSSARLVTQYKKTLGYGYIEAKIQIPSAKGIWPAFWAMGNNHQVWPRCGETDIMESFNTKKGLQSTIHFPRVDDNADLCNYCLYDVDDKTQWHTYGVYRDGNMLAFYFDRRMIDSYYTADGTYPCFQVSPWKSGTWEGKRSVLNDKQFLLLNVACGGNLAGGMPDSSLDVNMNVDYVRYYVENTATTAAPTTEVPTTTLAPTTTLMPTSIAPTPLVTTAVTPTLQPTKPVAVAKTKIKTAKNVKKRKIKLSIKKIKGVSGYQIRWCDNKKFDGYEQKNVKKPKLTIKGLDKKTTYWIKARAFKKVNSVKTYGKWSAKKKVKIKK